jgi:HAD superfamily hydrolase (TIGR01484 family)
MKALADITPAQLLGIKAVLTDIDDTLTLEGRLPAVAYAAVERLTENGLVVIPVTGRPAGWCDMIARMWPVEAVVGENGAFAFRYDRASRKMQRFDMQTAETRAANKQQLMKLAEQVLRDFPGTAFASDQAYREVDVAIDFCEDVPRLPLSVAEAIAARFHAAGAEAKISSIHVNAWFGQHDKLSMARRLLAERFGWDEAAQKRCVVYLGDSPNDAPMFAGFPLGVGVANIKPLAHLMTHLPAYVTEQEGGEGFAEFAELLLHHRKSVIT